MDVGHWYGPSGLYKMDMSRKLPTLVIENVAQISQNKHAVL